MSEQLPPTSNLDPTLLAPNPGEQNLGEKVTNVIGYFNSEFGLGIDAQGQINSEPTQEQLSALRQWHEATSQNGIIMPDMDTFTAKMVLAQALMPQVDESGKVQYLFGKGAGAELALQGNVEGRNKRQAEVPYRTHSDFEIYAAETDSYAAIAHSERFTAVFGGQEIYPVTKTKGLSDLPGDFLHSTSERVDYGGITFLVPGLEVQFVDKFEKANERVERGLREKTDAEWLAATYELDGAKIHEIIDDYVIAPELAKLQPVDIESQQTHSLLIRKVAEAKRRIKNDNPQASDADINSSLVSDFMLSQAARNKGIDSIGEVLNSETGELREDSAESLIHIAQLRQQKVEAALRAKHEAVDAMLAQAA